MSATLTSPAIQVRQIVAVSDGEGNYRFGELPVGVYTITFELAGFTTFIRNELRLPVGFVARVDVENNLLMVRGAVPGANGSVVIIKKSVKPGKKKNFSMNSDG